jgi:hypothetical protein
MKAKCLSIIFLVGTVAPCPALAGEDCHLVEYPDHYEAVCTGEARYVPQTEDKKPVTVIVVNGERRPPASVMENAAASRRKLILDLHRKDQENNAPLTGKSQ